MDTSEPSSAPRPRAWLLEIGIPLLIAAQYGVLLLLSILDEVGGMIVTFVGYLVVLPIALARWQRQAQLPPRRLDLYLLVLLEYAVMLVVLWLPGALIWAVFMVGSILLIRRPRPARRFTGLLVVCVLALVLSGGLVTAQSQSFLMAPVLTTLIFGIYFGLQPGSAWLRRPRITLTLGTMFLSYLALCIHADGAITPWMAGLVTRQPGVERIAPPSSALRGPRAVIPVEHGLMVYRNDDRFLRWEAGEVERCPDCPYIGRVDLPICDPEDRSICYVPTVDEGTTIVDTDDWSVRLVRAPVGHYDLINADAERRYFVLISDNGQMLSFAERSGPGALEPLGTLDMSQQPGWAASRAVDIEEGRAYIVVRTLAGPLEVYVYDIAGDALQKVAAFDSEVRVGGSWHAVTVPGERVVYTALSGRVSVFDWSGALRSQHQLLPMLRQVLYDPDRGLCYIVDDFGFITFVDPFDGKRLRTLFGGLKTKNLHLEGGDLYVGSSAGLFRIDIDRAIGSERSGRDS